MHREGRNYGFVFQWQRVGETTEHYQLSSGSGPTRAGSSRIFGVWASPAGSPGSRGTSGKVVGERVPNLEQLGTMAASRGPRRSWLLAGAKFVAGGCRLIPS